MYDVITLGGSTVDVFVETKKGPEIRNHLDHRDIAYHLGDKLLIKNLFFSVGGGGVNPARAFLNFGLKTAFIGAVGNDSNGRVIIEDLKKEKIDFLGKIKRGNSGFSVIIPGLDDRVILTYKGVNNSLSTGDLDLSKLKTKWLYISSMLGESLSTSSHVASNLKKSGTKIALSISLYLADKGLHYLSDLLKSVDVLILNKEEASLLAKKEKMEDIFDEIYRYTDAIIVITDGPNPIYASDGLEIFVRKIKEIKSVNKTGAGDAFASGFVFGLIKGKSIVQSLDCGYKESVSVIRLNKH